MSQRMDRKNYKIKSITRVKEKQRTQNANSLHHVAIKKPSSHTCYCSLDKENTQQLYLNMGNKACHANLHFVREAALEFNYSSLN